MPNDQSDPIILYLIVKQSLENCPNKVCVQIGDAVQYLLIYYFKAQVIKVKLHDISLPGREEKHIANMLEWLANHSVKIIKKANEDDWAAIKKDNTDIVMIKDIEANETVMALWPQHLSKIPSKIKDLVSF